MEQPALTLSASSLSFPDLGVRQSATPLPKGKQQLEAVFAGEGGAAASTQVDKQGKAAVVVRRNDSVSLQDQATAAAAAGAKLLVVVNDGIGKLSPWGDSIWAPNPPPITVATVTRDEGEQLITQLQKGRGTLTVESNPAIDYQYDMSRFWDHVPADPSYQPESRDLARLDVSYRNFRPGQAILNRYDVWNVDWESAMNSSGLPAQAERTEWVTAGVPYQGHAEIVREVQQADPGWTAYPAGSRSAVEWFGPIQRPRLSKGLSPVRLEDGLAIVAPGWGSGGDHYGTAFGNFDLTQKVSLFQGSTLVSEADRDQLKVSGLKSERLPYRLVVDNTRGTFPNPYSTATRTEWGFTSGAVAEAAPVSLIQLDYSVDTDAAGQAGRRTDLTISPKWSADSSAKGLRQPSVDVSYDDGKTWQRASMKHTSEGWTTRLDAPRSASFVTLRTHAEDSSGATINQQITRAFGLK